MAVVKVRGHSRLFQEPFKTVLLFSLLAPVMLAASGCDSSPSSRGLPPPSADIRRENLKTDISVEDARDLAQPAQAGEGFSVDPPSVLNEGDLIDPDLQGARGLNTRLFAAPVADEDARFERLETAVQGLRNDFDKVTPAINRLMAIEGDIQMLVEQLETLVGSDSQPMPSAAAPVVEQAQAQPLPAASLDEVTAPVPVKEAPPPAPVAQAPEPTPAPVTTPAAATSGPALTNIRMGDHPGKARIVFESPARLSYTAALDADNILIVTFSEGYNAYTPGKPSSALISSINITPQESGGFIAALPLTSSSRILTQGTLPPDSENSAYRIYIDLAR